MRRFVFLRVVLVLGAAPLGAAPPGQAHIPPPADLAGTHDGLEH